MTVTNNRPQFPPYVLRDGHSLMTPDGSISPGVYDGEAKLKVVPPGTPGSRTVYMDRYTYGFDRPASVKANLEHMVAPGVRPLERAIDALDAARHAFMGLIGR